jgi:hypothetical protein
MKFLFSLLFIYSYSAHALNHCAKDAAKFCQGVEQGRGQLARCLSDYQPQLDPNCARELKDFKNKTGKQNPCFEDLAEYCVDIPTDPEKLIYCLLKNENRLSSTCSADFKKKKGNFIVKDICAQDITNLCYPEVSAPTGSITKCLFQNKAKLSKFCQKDIELRMANMRKTNACFDETEKYCKTQVKVIDIQECLEKKLTTLTPGCKVLVEREKKKSDANPCYKDLVRHCRPGISTSQQHECLKINESDLSHTCRQFQAVEQEKVNKMVEFCEKDRLKCCANAPFKDGMILKCLKENKTKISLQCSKLL